MTDYWDGDETGLTLALLVAGILANNTNHTLATDDAAGFTQGLDGWTNSHGF